MARIRFDWREDLERLGERVDDFFDEIVGLATGPRNSFQASWRPAVDVLEVDDGIVVIAEIAGVALADVSVAVERGRLRISGTRRPPNVEQTKGPLQLEIEHGAFERVIGLPDGTDTEQTSAEFRDGLLLVRIPQRRGRTTVPIRGSEKAPNDDE